MNKLIKERLTALSNRENVGAICSDEIVAMARQLLAGMEQDPVAYIAKYESGAIHGTCDRDDPVKLEWLKRGMVVSPLYAAPQLPQPAVVGDDKFRAEFERWMVEDEKCIVGSSDPYPAGIESRNWRAWKACRAAMLQGDEPVQGWIPCSERMPDKGQEVLCTDQFDNYETALYDTGYIPGPPFFATTAGEFHPTHWMPLPAAPQQETK